MSAEHLSSVKIIINWKSPDFQPHSLQWERLLPVVHQSQITRNCDYCFQEHSGGIMEPSTVQAILRRVVNHNLSVDPENRSIQVYRQGGKPLPAVIEFFHEILRLEGRYPALSLEIAHKPTGPS